MEPPVRLESRDNLNVSAGSADAAVLLSKDS
jgi:hypothetical protein